MAWLERKKWFASSKKKRPRPERTYSVAEVAELFSVSKQTVMKWLMIDDETGESIISPEEWYKLPGSGYVRIKESAILRLQNNTTL
jgi:hypothetical protein